MARQSKENEPGRSTRITLPLTPDGTGLDFDSMRGSTKERLCDLMEANAAEIYRQAGRPIPGVDDAEAEAGPGLFGGLTLENVRAGLDILSQVNVLAFKTIAPRIIKHPFRRNATTGRPVPLVIDPDILASAFTLTPEQHAELDPRALRIAQKYSHKMPDWMKEHLDLVMLGSMYLKYTGENALRAMQIQVIRDRDRDMKKAAAQARPKPVDTDRVEANRITEEDPTGPDVYPPSQPSNGQAEVGL